jgi:hypothetical protein
VEVPWECWRVVVEGIPVMLTVSAGSGSSVCVSAPLEWDTVLGNPGAGLEVALTVGTEQRGPVGAVSVPGGS